MSAAVALFVAGVLLLAIGAILLAYPDAVPDSGMVSPNAITSDPEAAAEARRWNQIRGGIVAVLGVATLVGGLVTLL